MELTDRLLITLRNVLDGSPSAIEEARALLNEHDRPLRRIAERLLKGSSADIWTDAEECYDDINDAQQAMVEASNYLSAFDSAVRALVAFERNQSRAIFGGSNGEGSRTPDGDDWNRLSVEVRLLAAQFDI